MTAPDDVVEAAGWIRESRQLMVFSGAGISAESGIPTFRDDGGFWQEFPPEEFASWEGIVSTAARNPQQLARFLHAVIDPIAQAVPNAAHRVIAAAEERLPITTVTQNVDGLHQEAGSTIVHEIHGSCFEIVTTKGRFRDLVSRRELQQVASAILPLVDSKFAAPKLAWALRRVAGFGPKGAYHPRVVMFGDAMAEPAWSMSLEVARNCDCVLQVGCSNQVLPAAMLPHEAKARGAHIISVDPHDADGDLWLQGTATEIVPTLFELAFGDDGANANE